MGKNEKMEKGLNIRIPTNDGAKGKMDFLNYRNLSFLHFFILSFFLLSCHHHHEPEPEPTDQTILYYFPWSGNAKGSAGLYSDFQNNIREIENAITKRQTMANARLLVCMANKPYEAVLFEIKLDKGTTVRDTLATYSNVDFTKKETIRGFINDAKGYAPSLRYAMMIGCHGMGWLPVDDDASAKTNLARRKYFGGDKGFRAEITTLADAISESQTHLDFILFDDCYMANVEVAYDLHRVADHLIASTSEIMARGMPYEDIWQYLSPTPNYEVVCNAYHKFYSDYSYPYGTLAAIDCREVEAFAQLMAEANATHTFNEDDREWLQALDGYTPPIFFDCGHYIDFLCFGDSELLSPLTQQLQRLVPFKVNTPSVFSTIDHPHTVAIDRFSGITISDPSVNDKADGKEHTAWWKATHKY